MGSTHRRGVIDDISVDINIGIRVTVEVAALCQQLTNYRKLAHPEARALSELLHLCVCDRCILDLTF